jgi:hypothetical protein
MAGLIYNGTEDVINPNYLYTNQYWWSLTPRYMMSFGISYVYSVSSSGGLNSNYSVPDAIGVRPAVSIKGNTIVSGTGAADDPYIVVAP